MLLVELSKRIVSFKKYLFLSPLRCVLPGPWQENNSFFPEHLVLYRKKKTLQKQIEAYKKHRDDRLGQCGLQRNNNSNLL
jgi:hypothetical protein